MSIPTPFNPLGTLGASPIPPEYSVIDQVESTRVVSVGEIPSAFRAPDFRRQTLRVVGGYRSGISNSRPIFGYHLGWVPCAGFTFSWSQMLLISNAYQSQDAATIGWARTKPVGSLYDAVMSPTSVELDGVSRAINGTQIPTNNSYEVIDSFSIIASVEILEGATLLGQLVAVERKSDGVKGLFDTVTKTFVAI